jgi:hypothetical protein
MFPSLIPSLQSFFIIFSFFLFVDKKFNSSHRWAEPANNQTVVDVRQSMSGFALDVLG